MQRFEQAIISALLAISRGILMSSLDSMSVEGHRMIENGYFFAI
jgi:hypothetical protein